MFCEKLTGISLIHELGNGLSNVVNFNLGGLATGTKVLPDAPGYIFFNERRVDCLFDRRIEKGISSLSRLLGILGTGNTFESHPCVPPGQVAAKVMPDGFISRPSSSNETKESEMTNIFTGVQFEYRNGYISKPYFETRLCVINPESPKTLGSHRPNFEPNVLASSRGFTNITIDTGMCMFSRARLAAPPKDDESGVPVTNEALIPPLPSIDPTMYELEIIARLSATIADIVGRLESQDTGVVVNLDIPDFQYYWKACSLLQKGLVDGDYVQTWMGAMDLRKSQLGAVMTEMIRSAMDDRGLVGLNVQMKTAAGSVPTVDDVIDALTSKGPEAAKWRVFLSAARAQDQPSTMDELGKLVYVFKTVKSVLTLGTVSIPTSHVGTAVGRSLIVQVNDVTDWRIFDRAKTFLKRYSKIAGICMNETIIVGVFPLQRIFLTGSGRSNLYDHQSSREYLNQEKRRYLLDCLDIIQQVHGTNVAQQLRHSVYMVFLHDERFYGHIRAASRNGCSKHGQKVRACICKDRWPVEESVPRFAPRVE
ncbi:hypothetical protein MAA_10551 [Metarhizium robertsii ARSEF 23]|uniref:Uncharacterized protein n=1 Tax=Metarhizium robertsii (strain ARSEF 23 / ATCC MYA-3075) TaxID=655844 RepID=E9FE52_METRA|nr:uncharacterized protein MAA_10551 [Metarhizium robertsii ARSEF 23]EFY93987.2 hypothetical protein MAA_10551 [Metarhizium robertsii ARSEF 23]